MGEDGAMGRLDLTADVINLTAAICDIASVSRQEGHLADLVEEALRDLAHLQVDRNGNTIVARTQLGRAERVLLAGHLDTVPITDAPNVPTRRDGDELWGRGTVDMKGGVAVQLKLAAELANPSRDITYVFYDCEEIDAAYNGLGRVVQSDPELLRADFAVLLEPTNAGIEGGCKGTVRFEIATTGIAAHSGRPWKGHNAIHDAAPVLQRLQDFRAETVEVDGLAFHEGLSAVKIEGGIAGNVVPDRCVVTVNYRFAPDKSLEEATRRMRALFEGYDLTITDGADGARPGLGQPAAHAFVDALAVPVIAKEGWTDVARFSALGIPAVNFGPGDPGLAHADEERCPVSQYTDCLAALHRWLG